METDIRTKDNIISDYKEITKQLSSKLDKIQARGDMPNMSDNSQVNGCSPLDTALERIRELELELAQTKLALVETECKNQDLTHQFNNAGQGQVITSNYPQTNTWLSKTLTSIKEVTGSKGVKQSPENMKKSSSEQVLCE